MRTVASEAYAHWDADRYAKVGKLLGALGGNRRYRLDLDEAEDAVDLANEALWGSGSQPAADRPSVVRDMGADRRCVVWIDGAYRDNEGVERTMLGAYLRDCNVSFSDRQITELMTLPTRTEAWERRQGTTGGAV